MSYSKVLKDLMVSYIDGVQLASSTLKEKLRLTTPDVRYELLRDVRGVQWVTWTAVSKAACIHDLEGLLVMLDGLSPAQKYNIVKIPTCYSDTPLQFAIDNSSTHGSSIEIVELLLREVSSEQQFQQYKFANDKGNTALHYATFQNKAKVIERILNSCTREQKVELLSIRNKAGQSVADRSVSAIFSTVQELEETKKQLRDRKKVRDEQIQKLERALDVTGEELNTHKISSQVQVDELRIQNDQLKQALQDTRDELKSSQRQIDRLQEKNDEQEQVIQALSARQAAMEQMVERLELEFRRPIVTDETGDQELEELDE